MKNVWMPMVLAAMMMAPGIAEEAASQPVAAAKESVSIPVPTVAVLPFAARGARNQNEDIGKSVAELVTVELLKAGEFDLVDRADLEKVLTELHLSATGLVSSETQLKLGQLVGAKILITGSVFSVGEKNFIVTKIIGTETSRVEAKACNGNVEATELVPELGALIADCLKTQAGTLLPKPRNVLSVAGKLSEDNIKGNGRRVYVKIRESISIPAADPAAETEFKKLLIALGFEVVEDRGNAEYSFIGEGLATDSGSYQQFSSSTARLELTLYKGKERVLASDRQKETIAGASYVIAAKDALAAASLALGQRMVPEMK